MEKILGIFLKGFKVREMSNGELRKNNYGVVYPGCISM